MKLAELQAQFDELTAKLETSEVALAEKTSALEAVAGNIAEMTAQLETATQSLAAVEGELTTLKAEKAEAALASRKASLLAAAVPAERVEGMMASLASLDDATFQTVVDGFAATKATVEQSALMTEIGQEAEAELVKADADVDPADAATRAAIKRASRT